MLLLLLTLLVLPAMEDEESKMFSSLFFPNLDPIFAAELMGENDRSLVQRSESKSSYRNQNSNSTTDDTQRAKKKPYQRREHIKRVPKEEANWYRRYLTDDKRKSIELGEAQSADADGRDKKLSKEFYYTFRIYWSLFKVLVDMALTRGFYNPSKKDIMGFSHDLELLLLGSLFFLGWDTTFDYISTNTEIDSEAQRVFHHCWTKNMMSIKDSLLRYKLATFLELIDHVVEFIKVKV